MNLFLQFIMTFDNVSFNSAYSLLPQPLRGKGSGDAISKPYFSNGTGLSLLYLGGGDFQRCPIFFGMSQEPT